MTTSHFEKICPSAVTFFELTDSKSEFYLEKQIQDYKWEKSLKLKDYDLSVTLNPQNFIKKIKTIHCP